MSNSTLLRATIADPSGGTSSGGHPLSISTPASAPQQRQSLMSERDRVGGGVLRATIVDGKVSYEDLGVQRGSTEITPVAGAGILNGARSISGSPVDPFSINDDTVLTLPGGGTALAKHLISAGYVAKDENGRYVDPNSRPSTAARPAGAPSGNVLDQLPTLQSTRAAQAAEQEAAQAEAARVEQSLVDAGIPKAEPFTVPAAESISQQLAADLSLETQVTIAREVSTTGDISERSMMELAAQTGMSPELASSIAGRMRQAFTEQADDAVSAFGVEPSDVWAWANAERPDDVQRAIQQQIRSRSAEGYRALAKNYLENLADLDPELLLGSRFGAGVSVRREGKQLVVDTPKGSFTWKSAVQNNIVTIRR